MPRRKSQPVETAVADRLHSAAIHLLRRVRVSDTDSGLGPARLSALSVLVFGAGRGGEPISLGALAAAEQVKPPTMTRIVAALEKDGLVKREVDTKDARVARVRATPRGVRILERARRLRIRYLAERLRSLGSDELALLQKAAGIMEAVSRDKASRLKA